MKESLPPDRPGFTRKFKIKYVENVVEKVDGVVISTPTKCELKFYVTFSTYTDGRISEVFIKGAKVGELTSGVLNAVAKIFSVGLQYGVPLQDLTSKIRHDRFEPAGVTGDPDFPTCSSFVDLIAQYLDYRFPTGKLCPYPASHKSLAIREEPCPDCAPIKEPNDKQAGTPG